MRKNKRLYPQGTINPEWVLSWQTPNSHNSTVWPDRRRDFLATPIHQLHDRWNVPYFLDRALWEDDKELLAHIGKLLPYLPNTHLGTPYPDSVQIYIKQCVKTNA